MKKKIQKPSGSRKRNRTGSEATCEAPSGTAQKKLDMATALREIERARAAVRTARASGAARIEYAQQLAAERCRKFCWRAGLPLDAPLEKRIDTWLERWPNELT